LSPFLYLLASIRPAPPTGASDDAALAKTKAQSEIEPPLITPIFDAITPYSIRILLRQNPNYPNIRRGRTLACHRRNAATDPNIKSSKSLINALRAHGCSSYRRSSEY